MLPAESLTVFPEVPSYMIMWFHSFLLRSYFTRIQRKVLQHLKLLFLSIVLSQRLPESSAYVFPFIISKKLFLPIFPDHSEVLLLVMKVVCWDERFLLFVF